MRQRIPIVYLVDSAGVNLPYQGGVFPGQYGAARIFYYNSIMRHYLKVPQIAAVMGPCIAGGAYLPAMHGPITAAIWRTEEHTSEPQSPDHHICRLLLEYTHQTP